MNWLKKNLFLVGGGVIALGLLGFAVFFLLTNKQGADEVGADLSTQTQELKRLATSDPYPNQENIESARKEQKKVGEFLQECRRFFVPVTDLTNVDSATFKNLLETAISEMVRDAEKAGVALPNSPAAKYDFTFKPQRSSVVFVPETLVPLATQVAEIKAICDVLFDARVHALTGLRRMPVAKEDDSATDYLLGKKATTNAVTGAVLAPYEIQFQGFTAEMAAVLEGFYRSSNCFIVRNIDVQTNVLAAAFTPEGAPSYLPYPTYAPPPSQLSPGDVMRQRYGGMGPGGRYGPFGGGGRYGQPGLGPGSRYAPPPALTPGPTPGAVAAHVRRGPETILDERPFKVTMYVEAVRLIERARSKSAK
ncbi:MAG: hypothetical protein DME18_04055 [Verrucomicrobia bacterium]|nr:MAG: hypothetical protein DME18_04055 [Verrucomicrobiota bacterium]